MNEISRSKTYELTAICLYDAIILINMKEEIDMDEMLSNVFATEKGEPSALAKAIFLNALNHYNEIISTLQKNMDRWRFSRLNQMIQAILIMSYSNYYYVGDIDKAVVINVAIKLAKKYGDDKEYKFVNAILDNVLK